MPRGRARDWTYAQLGVPVNAVWTAYNKYKDGWLTEASYAYAKRVAQGRPVGYSHVTVVECPEHGCAEIVPSSNYYTEMQPWYKAGRHPRWSITQVLFSLKQRLWETRGLIHEWQGGPEIVSTLLRKSGSRRDFIRGIQPHLWVWIRHHGQRVRVRQAFAQQYRAKSFNVQNFLDETNQELRRLMIRRGFDGPDVEKKLGKPIATDAEGRLYNYRNTRYLAVTCPSTSEQYVLQVPERARVRASATSDLTMMDLNTPAMARRWTFGLPMDAQFVTEA